MGFNLSESICVCSVTTGNTKRSCDIVGMLKDACIFAMTATFLYLLLCYLCNFSTTIFFFHALIAFEGLSKRIGVIYNIYH